MKEWLKHQNTIVEKNSVLEGYTQDDIFKNLFLKTCKVIVYGYIHAYT